MTDDQVARFNKRLKKIDKALDEGTLTGEDPFPADYKILLRLPAALASKIRDGAKQNRRSINSEIVTWLEKYQP